MASKFGRHENVPKGTFGSEFGQGLIAPELCLQIRIAGENMWLWTPIREKTQMVLSYELLKDFPQRIILWVCVYRVHCVFVSLFVLFCFGNAHLGRR